jgi:hypothetical protein
MHPRSLALPSRIILFAFAAIILSLVPFSAFSQDKKAEPMPTPNVARTPNVSKDAQPTPTPAKPKEEPKPTPTPKAKEEPKQKKVDPKDAFKNPTVDQVVEASILVYAFPGGREKMKQIRKTEMERGKLVMTGADGQVTNANYQRWSSRGDVTGKEKIRLDQELPTATYSVVQADDKIFGIYNDSTFALREDAAATFQNRVAHSIESLLFYKENGSTIQLAGKDKILGVDFYLVDLTDKIGRKTRYYISAKTFRVMQLDYETGGVKHTRKFRDYKYAQGVLVPFFSELSSGDKVIETVTVGTVTFGQKVDDSLFTASAS